MFYSVFYSMFDSEFTMAFSYDMNVREYRRYLWHPPRQQVEKAQLAAIRRLKSKRRRQAARREILSMLHDE